MTTPMHNEYFDILKEKRILYVPSCLIVEMMLRLYSQVSLVNIGGNPHMIVPDLLIMLRRLSGNLSTTAEAYREKRIGTFLGNWREEKLRARKLLFNIMSRLGYISELLVPMERMAVYRAVETLSRDWAVLDEMVEKNMPDTCRHGGCTHCRSFRNLSPAKWQGDMARTILSLDAGADYTAADHLILLCYHRIKTKLLRAIDEIEAENGNTGVFSPDKILVVSHEDVSIICPSCTQTTDSVHKGAGETIHRNYRPATTATTAMHSIGNGGGTRRNNAGTHRNGEEQPSHTRRVMPPSLAGIGFGVK